MFSKLLPIEFAVGVAMTLALYLLDKCGKSSALLNVAFLIIITTCLLHPALSIPWILSSPSTAITIWRGALIACVIVLGVAWFGIWTWPDVEPRKATKSTLPESALSIADTDLKASIVGSSYNFNSHELITDVVFINDGDTRRTIVSAKYIFQYPTPDGHGGQLSFPQPGDRDIIIGTIKPVYAIPKSSEITTYSFTIPDPNIFGGEATVGLAITSIGRDGHKNSKDVFFMKLKTRDGAEFGTNWEFWPSTISLDSPNP